LNIESNFTPEVVLWPFPRMRTKSGQNNLKRGQIAKKSQVLYEIADRDLDFALNI